MVIAGLVSDFIMMHVHKSREKYRAGKVTLVEDAVIDSQPAMMMHPHIEPFEQ